MSVTSKNHQQVYDLQMRGYEVKGFSPQGEVLMYRPARWRWSLLDLILAVFTLGVWLLVVAWQAATKGERTVVVDANGEYQEPSDLAGLVGIVVISMLMVALVALIGQPLVALGVIVLAWVALKMYVDSK